MRLGIIGGGAAGLCLAVQAARLGIEVLMVEHMDMLGKKILSTGNGRCNYGNRVQEQDCYYGNEAAFRLTESFSYEDSLAFFNSLGVYPLEREGYVYPFSEQASAIRNALLMEIRRLGVTVYTRSDVRKLEREKGFCIHIESRQEEEVKHYRLRTDYLAFATGSKAFPKSGSDGSALVFLKQWGIPYRDFAPALCPLPVAELPFLKRSAGVRTMARLSLWVEKENIREEYGQMQLTERALSGIPVFQLACKAQRALQEGKKAEIAVDYLPFVEDKLSFLEERISSGFFEQAGDLGNGILADKLFSALLHRAGIRENKKAADLSEKDRRMLAALLGNSRYTLRESLDFEKAQVCTGGIPLEALQESLESKTVPGLYFAGEILDVDAICGGYNLHWAWASATRAARAIAARSKERKSDASGQ